MRSSDHLRTSPSVDIRLLGPLRLEVDGAPVALGPRANGLLAILALHAGAPVTSDRLIDGLWGEDVPPSARNTLQTHITHLRQALEPGRPRRAPPRLLVTVGGAYQLAVAPEAVDVHRFERAARTAIRASGAEERRAAARAALAHWAGEPLADLGSHALVTFERTRLVELRREVLEVLAEAASELGHQHEAIVVGEDLVGDHPYDEHTWALLIRSLYRAGRQAEALSAFQRARRRLRDELGLGPSPELRALEAQVLAQDAGLVAPTPPELGGGRPAAANAPHHRAGRPPSGRDLRIVIADDHLVVREGLQRLVELDDRVAVVAVCGSLGELLEATVRHRPDVVLTDIRMPPTFSDEGVQAAQWLRTSQPDVGVVVLSQFAEPAYAMAVLRDGAGRRGYLLKETVRRPAQLHEAIHNVAAGGSTLDPAVVDLLVQFDRAS